MIRRSLTALAIAVGASLLPFAAPAHAEAPAVGTQVPGYYRMAPGPAARSPPSTTATWTWAPACCSAPARPTCRSLLASKFIAGEKVQTAVNAYLINAGGKLILVDAGAAKAFGPTLGFIGDQLRAAGYSPEQVDVVLLTHLHADHVAGILTPRPAAVPQRRDPRGPDREPTSGCRKPTPPRRPRISSPSSSWPASPWPPTRPSASTRPSPAKPTSAA